VVEAYEREAEQLNERMPLVQEITKREFLKYRLSASLVYCAHYCNSTCGSTHHVVPPRKVIAQSFRRLPRPLLPSTRV